MGRTSDARERLIASGGELMHDRGYTAVGVGEVCSTAGVNKGSFYHFFPSKQALALEVIDRFADASAAPVREMVSGDGSPVERLRRFLDSIYAIHKGVRAECGRIRGCPLGNLALEMSTQDAVLRDRLEVVFEHQVQGFETVIAEAVERGEVSDVDPPRAARSLLAFIEGSTMLAKMHDDPEVLRGLGGEALRLLGLRDSPQE